jgi:hypothetical protein
MRKLNPVMIVVGLLALVAVIVVTAVLVPQQLHPAYASAIDFVQAAASGDDAEAESHISQALADYVVENCPDGSISACVDAYTPDDWGGFLNVVYRRAQPDGPDAWDILLLGTWEENQGFSGVCIYTRAERAEPNTENWEIVGWSGFVSCSQPNAGLSQLAQDDAPNRAP